MNTTTTTNEQYLEMISPDFAKIAREMRYILNPANGPEIKRRNWRRKRVGLPPLEEYVTAVYHRELEQVLNLRDPAHDASDVGDVHRICHQEEDHNV
jgi:hypothetical protein